MYVCMYVSFLQNKVQFWPFKESHTVALIPQQLPLNAAGELSTAVINFSECILQERPSFFVFYIPELKKVRGWEKNPPRVHLLEMLLLLNF